MNLKDNYGRKLISLEEICYFKNGKSITITNNGTMPIYGSTGIIGYTEASNVIGGSVIIARVGMQCGCAYLAYHNGWATDNTIIATPKNGVSSKYINYLLSTLNLNSYKIGAAQPLITSSLLKTILIECHSENQQQHIVNTISNT